MRLLLFVTVALVLATPLHAQQARPTPKAGGYLLHEWPDGRQTVYAFEVRSDTTVWVRQGRHPDAPAVLLPSLVAKHLTRQVNQEFDSETEENLLFNLQRVENRLRLVFHSLQQFRVSLFVLSLLAMLLSFAFCFWLWRQLRAERERRIASESARKFLAKGRENERRRLAREIHDGPVQDLHGLHFQLAGHAAGSGALAETIGDVVRELRAVSARLHPPALQRFGLAAALRSHAQRVVDTADPPSEEPVVNVAIDEEAEAQLSDSEQLAVFRIAQEAMSNALQHGHATTVDVHLGVSDRRIQLRIDDNGDGFDVPEALDANASTGHYGLLGMQDRANALGATLDVASQPADGTTVRMSMGLDAPDGRPPIRRAAATRWFSLARLPFR